MKSTIKDRVLSARKAMGLSQPELAKLIDVHALTVSKWERGVLEPTNYQQALLHTLKVGFMKSPEFPLTEHLTIKGPLATLAYLLASAYGFKVAAK